MLRDRSENENITAIIVMVMISKILRGNYYYYYSYQAILLFGKMEYLWPNQNKS